MANAEPMEVDFLPTEIDPYTQFNKYKLGHTNTDYAQNSIFYLFMTAPSLNIRDGENIKHSSFMRNLLLEDENVFNAGKLLDSLCYQTASKPTPFIHLITNTCQGFDPPDSTISVINLNETWTHLKFQYPGYMNDSLSGGTLNIEYRDLDELPVLKLHKIWVDYMELLSAGYAVPLSDNRNARILDFMSSIYFFSCKPDGMTIQYWSKYTGVFPTSVPYSTIAAKAGGSGDLINYSIPYSFVFKEDMEIDTLFEFNMVMNDTASTLPTFNSGDISDKAIEKSSDFNADIDKHAKKGFFSSIWDRIKGNSKPEGSANIDENSIIFPEYAVSNLPKYSNTVESFGKDGNLNKYKSAQIVLDKQVSSYSNIKIIFSSGGNSAVSPLPGLGSPLPTLPAQGLPTLPTPGLPF
jgi:hypothetical protein